MMKGLLTTVVWRIKCIYSSPQKHGSQNMIPALKVIRGLVYRCLRRVMVLERMVVLEMMVMIKLQEQKNPDRRESESPTSGTQQRSMTSISVKVDKSK